MLEMFCRENEKGIIMKKLLKLLGLLFIASIISNNALAQITVLEAYAVDLDQDGIYDAIELKFSEPVDDTTFTSTTDEINDWLVSPDNNFNPTSYVDTISEFSTSVNTIAVDNDANDEYVTLKFIPRSIGDAQGILYYGYEKTGVIDGALTTNTISAIGINPGSEAVDKAGPYIVSVSCDPVTGETVGIGTTITFNIVASEIGFTLTADTIAINNRNIDVSELNGSGPFTIDYLVLEGHNDVPDGSAIPIYLVLLDDANNPSPVFTTFDYHADSCPAIDANSPKVSSVNFNPGDGNVLGIDSTLVLTIIADGFETGLDESTILINNEDITGIGNFLETGPAGYYNIEYTVSSPDGNIIDATQELPISIILSDGVNDTDPAYTTSFINNSPGVDSDAPSISGISLSETNGILGIGDTLVFTINAGESGLIADVISINNEDLKSKLVDLGTGFYDVEYIIQATDDNIAEDAPIPVSFILKDIAGNPTVNYTTLAFDDCPGIDTNIPSIISVSLSNHPKSITDTDTLIIQVDTDTETADYSLISGSVGGFNITLPVERIDDDQLRAIFTITDNNINILADENVEVASLQIQDKAGNKSNIYSPTISQDNDALYGKMPQAQIFGSESICKNDTTDAPVLLTGIPPFKITYYNGDIYTDTTDILETYYNVEAIADSSIGDNPLLYTITKVEDATGNFQPGEGTFELGIYGLPNVHFLNPQQDNTFDISIDTVFLSANPAGGTFYGDGVISTHDIFNPSASGPAGDKTLVYDYTNENGCRDTVAITVEVIEGGTIIFTEGTEIYCSYSAVFGVEGINNDGKIGTFTLEDDPFPSAISSDGDNKALIDPGLLEARSYNITYSYGDAPVIEVVRSFSIEEVTGYINPISDYCEDYSSISIEAKDLSPLLGTSYFDTSGVNITQSGHTLNFAAGELSPGSYTIDYYYESQNNCFSDITQETFYINELAAVEVTMEKLYDLYGGTDTIYGLPTVIPGTTGIFTPSFMIDQEDGSAIFDPLIAGEGIDTAYYTYTDLNGCANFDTAVFEVNQADGEILGLDEFDSHYQYCFYNSTTDTVWAKAYNGDGTKGTFYIDDVKVIAELGTDSIIINPSTLSEGNHELRFSYRNKSVVFNITESFHVDVITGLQIESLASEYCQNDAVVTLDGENGLNSGNGIFSGNGISGFEFSPSNEAVGLGLDTITYTFTSTTSGCIKSIDSTTFINKIPDIDFKSTSYCVSSITDSVFFVADTTLSDTVTEWSWRISFNTIQESDSVSPKISLVPQEKNRVELTLKNYKGCSSTKDSSIFIGSKVALDFTWDKECDGDRVTFTVDPYSHGGVDTIFWNFGELGIDTILPPFNDIDSVYIRTYKYATAGQYNVTYSEYTSTCGIIDTTKTINIRPSVAVINGGYFDDFEEGPSVSGWAVDVLASNANVTWEWGNPSGTKINSAANGSNAFVTNLDGNYRNNELSILSSPCFDLRELNRPMIAFDYICATQEDFDGVLFEYSTDIGVWQTLGVADKGVYWYNSNEIISGVLGQPTGWTDDGNGSPQVEVKWRGAKYTLDDITELEGVRFRFIFGSDGILVDEGFGFDNIQIENRNRTVLVENFTHQDDLQYEENQGIINEILTDYPLDATAIQYFTSYPTENDINMFYTSGPSARSLYYGVSLVPYSIVDGGDRQFNYSSTNKLSNSDVVKRMLEESQFKVTVQQEVSGSELEVSSTIKSLNDLANIKLSARIAVVEKGVSDTIQNVLRTMLPDPAGILFVDDWNKNDSATIYQTWTIPEEVNKDSIITIVYLQDEETKEIYQAGYTDVFSEVTSIEKITESLASISYIAYPNPVSGQLTVRLVNAIAEDIEVRIYNNTGSMVKVDKIWKGTDRIEINTDDLPVGVYYLKLQSEDKLFSTKKIIKSN